MGSGSMIKEHDASSKAKLQKLMKTSGADGGHRPAQATATRSKSPGKMLYTRHAVLHSKKHHQLSG